MHAKTSHYLKFRWFAPAILLLSAALLVALGRYALPFGVSIDGLDSATDLSAIDPNQSLKVNALGFGTILSLAEIKGEQGETISKEEQTYSFSPPKQLEFGKKYKIIISAARPWLGQSIQREISFSTPSIPRINSPLQQSLGAEGSFHLHFSEPAIIVGTSSDIKLATRAESQGQSDYILSASPDSYTQGNSYKVQIQWKTVSGINLPPFEVTLNTAPPLSAIIPINGMKNLGVSMPVQIDFSEPLANRDQVSLAISVTTQEGDEIAGQWLWYGKQRAQFSPQPGWPASRTILITVNPYILKSVQGGFVGKPVQASFNTGPDRRIQVFLDRQRVEAIENDKIVKVLRASTGKSKTPTVTGDFYIYARFPTKTMKSTGLKPGEKGYYEVKDVPFAQYFHEGYAFHGAFWHNSFGQPASHGCINLATQKQNSRAGVNEDAGWLYQWASLGVPVTVYRNSPAKESSMREDEHLLTPP